IDKSVLQAPMTLLARDAKIAGTVTNASSPTAYLVNHNAENTLMTLRFKLKELKIATAEEPFEAGGQKFNAGTFIIKSADNPGDLKQKLAGPIADSGLKAIAVEKPPNVKRHLLAVPHIAILDTWMKQQNERWDRVALGRMQ